MAKTRDDIHRKVIAILVGGDVGMDVSDEDAETIDGYIDALVDELGLDATAYIADANDLENGMFMTFCKLVANDAADEFGGKTDETKAAQLRNRMRVLVRQAPGYGPQQVAYY